MRGMRDAGCVIAWREHDPRVKGRFSYPEARCSEPRFEGVAAAARGLEYEGRLGVVPGGESRRLRGTEAAPPPLNQPRRMSRGRIPHPASRLPCQPSQFVGYEGPPGLPLGLARERHAG